MRVEAWEAQAEAGPDGLVNGYGEGIFGGFCSTDYH